eukprot:1316093-Rhodomonas_salina.1
MAMFLASQGASGDDDQTDKVEAAAEPSGGTEGGSSSSTAEAATAAAERRKRRRFTETADEAASSTAATSDVVAATISSALEDQESSKPEGDQLVTSSWGKKYKAGFVPKSSHVGNLLPEDELAKYTSALPWNQGKKKEEEKPKDEPVIDESNVGHKLLSKMGWKAGKGLGANENGKVAPVAEEVGAGERSGHLSGDMGGVGAKHTWSLEGDEDMFEQYRKRMMLGYRHRPNPNGNPRKLYY